MDFNIATDNGQYDIEAHVRFIGGDLLVAIWGGEKPHIGAVAVAQPRPSLDDPKRTSATTSVICMLGHKEDELARSASLKLASALNTHVVVTAGIHWDNIPQEGISQVIRNSESIVQMIMDRIV